MLVDEEKKQNRDLLFCFGQSHQRDHAIKTITSTCISLKCQQSPRLLVPLAGLGEETADTSDYLMHPRNNPGRDKLTRYRMRTRIIFIV